MLSFEGGRSFLDPRTKLVLLITLPTFLLGGAGGEYLRVYAVILALFPFFLLFISKNHLPAVTGLLLYVAVHCSGYYISRYKLGAARYFYLFIYDIFCYLLPCGILAAFIMRTTTVSEFIAGMRRLHIPQFIIIPLSVMFRFLPAVREDMADIDRALRMRGINVKSVGLLRLLECKMVPVLMSTMRTGNELTASAMTKGMGLGRERTCIYPLGFSPADVAVLLFCLSAYIVLILSWFDIRFW